MSDDPDVRVQRALAHVLPSPAAAADLADALATATQAPPRGARPVLWVGLTVAAVLILAVGGAVLWRVPGSGHGARKIVAAPLDGRTVRVHVDAEGIVVLDDLRGAMLVTVDLGGTQTRASDGLAVLERALVELAANAPRDLNRVSTLALELVPSPNARWRWMQWIMQVAANPNVQIDRIRFGAEGSDGPPIEQHLPGDATQTTNDGSKSVGVVVTLLEPSLQPGVVRISLGGRAGPAWAVHLGSAPAPTEFGVVEI